MPNPALRRTSRQHHIRPRDDTVRPLIGQTIQGVQVSSESDEIEAFTSPTRCQTDWDDIDTESSISDDEEEASRSYDRNAGRLAAERRARIAIEQETQQAVGNQAATETESRTATSPVVTGRAESVIMNRPGTPGELSVETSLSVTSSEDDESFPFPLTQPRRRRLAETPPLHPIDVPQVLFNETFFQEVVDELIRLQGHFAGTSDPPSPEISSLVPQQSETLTHRHSEPHYQPPATDPTRPTTLTRLQEAYPSHTASLRMLHHPGYQEAYKICLRVRLYQWVTKDLPPDSDISQTDLLTWIGVGALKTFKNMVSRFNGAKAFLEWLQRQGENLDTSDVSIRCTLSKLVEGPLTPLPLDHQDWAEGSDDGAAVDALRVSAAKLDRWILIFRERQRIVRNMQH